jgi:toxin YoeB
VRLIFSPRAWEEYQHWIENDPIVHKRLNDLIKECKRTSFKGGGKPEPLKGDLQGFWSRRLTKEHRLVYRVKGKDADQFLEIASCRFHY